MRGLLSLLFMLRSFLRDNRTSGIPPEPLPGQQLAQPRTAGLIVLFLMTGHMSFCLVVSVVF